LNKYFASRSNLKTYTLAKEVHRMDYTVITKDGKKCCGADEIRNEFNAADVVAASPAKSGGADEDPSSFLSALDKEETREELIWRASNQSILADALIVLSPDLIRPEFMATAKATSVSFLLDFSGDIFAYSSECRAKLGLSIPLEDSRLEIAGVEILLKYSIEKFTCEVLGITITPDLWSSGVLDQAAKQFSDPLSTSFQSTSQLDNKSQADLYNQRDVLILQGLEGFGGALRQLDETTGISNKIDAVSTYFTKDLKSCLEEYDREIYQEEFMTTNNHTMVHRPESLLGSMFNGISKAALLATQPTEVEEDIPLKLYRQMPITKPIPTVEHLKDRHSYIDTKVLACEGSENGWSDDDFDFADDSDVVSRPSQDKNYVKSISVEKQDDPPHINADDIGKRRKRWIRPHWKDYNFNEDADKYVAPKVLAAGWQDQ